MLGSGYAVEPPNILGPVILSFREVMSFSEVIVEGCPLLGGCPLLEIILHKMLLIFLFQNTSHASGGS